MTIINGEISNQLGAKLDGTVWIAAAYHRPVDNVLVLADWAATPLRDSAFSAEAMPGPARLRVEAGSVFAEWDIVIPDDGPVEVTALMQDSIDYPEPVILAAQAAANRATQEANRAAASAAIVGSAERVLEAEEAAAGSASRALASEQEALRQAGLAAGHAADAGRSAGEAAGSVSKSQSEADRAKTQASAADASASTATQKATQATSAAASALTNMGYAQSSASNALAAQNAAYEHRTAAQTAASTATTEADRATTEADRAQAAADSVDTDVIRREVTDQIAAVVDGAPEDLDTIREVAEYAQENRDITDTLNAAIGQKADKAHTHAVADVTGLQAALDGKAPTVHSHTMAQVTGLDAALGAKLDAAKIQAVSAMPPTPVAGTIYYVTGA